MAKMIAVTGAPGSGSTTVSIQLAMKCAEQGETVCIIFCDNRLPPKAYAIKNPKEDSLGKILAAQEITDRLLLSAMDAVSDDVGVLGYCAADHPYSYPEPTAASCQSFLKKASLLVTTLIVDIGSETQTKLSAAAFEQADVVIVCVDGSVKASSWKVRLHRPEKYITVLNDLGKNSAFDAEILLPYSADLAQQNEEQAAFRLCRDKKYRSALRKLYEATDVKKKKLTLIR